MISILACLGCEDRSGLNKMNDQGRMEPYEDNSARPIVEGTVARGQSRLDSHFYAGKISGQPAQSFPFPITRQILERGQERYMIYCSVCHGASGDGNGMIVQRGFVPPPSFLGPSNRGLDNREQYLRTAPPGHIFDAITNGWGAMYSYADRIEPADRWAIAAYIRVLQLSQRADPTLLTAEDQGHLSGNAP